MKRKVFVSWSGDRSRIVAAALRTWLPDVLQNCSPFMSEEDIAKGRRGGEAITSELRDAAVGVICLTPENLAAPWILFEAGALSNSLKARELVCPYLVGLRKSDVEAPLSQFQLTDADHDDSLRLVLTINGSFEAEYRVAEADLKRRFEKWWPDLHGELEKARTLPLPSAQPQQRRPPEDVIDEVLETVRRLELNSVTPPRVLRLVEQSSAGLRVGQRVRHPQFGVGTIALIAGEGRDCRLTVGFDQIGTKKLMERYCSLKLVEDEAPGLPFTDI